MYTFPLFRHVARTIHRWITRFNRVEPPRAINHFRLTKLSTSDISMKHGKLGRYTVGPRTWVVYLRLLFDSSHGGEPKDTNQHQALDMRARIRCPRISVLSGFMYLLRRLIVNYSLQYVPLRSISYMSCPKVILINFIN